MGNTIEVQLKLPPESAAYILELSKACGYPPDAVASVLVALWLRREWNTPGLPAYMSDAMPKRKPAKKAAAKKAKARK